MRTTCLPTVSHGIPCLGWGGYAPPGIPAHSGPMSGGLGVHPTWTYSSPGYPPPRHTHPPERTWDQRYSPPGQTDTCENNTFPQLRLRVVEIFTAVVDAQNGRRIHSIKISQSQSLHLSPYIHYLHQISLSLTYSVNELSFNNRTEIGNSHSLRFTTILCKLDVCLNRLTSYLRLV